jgi:hypothetical protein
MELYRGKLPTGWSRRIPNHYESDPNNSNRRIRSPEYESYYSMLQRCYGKYQRNYPRNESYQRYGVLVCSRWVLGDGAYSGFECFLRDLGRRPDGHTLDRVLADKHYTPDNCCWSDSEFQAVNKRDVCRK